MDLRKVFKRYGNVFESFVYKTSSKKNDELITKADAAFVPDGVYILHETLGNECKREDGVLVVPSGVLKN